MGYPDFAFAMSTHPGRVRSGNEDFCAAAPGDHAFVVCDGMGGAAAGEVASQLAAEQLLRFIASSTGLPNPGDRLREAIYAANQAVYYKGLVSEHLQGMGTTLVAALVDEPRQHPDSVHPPAAARLWIGHVGDSRCYLHRAHRLHLLTMDHSVVEEQIQAGYLSRDEAELSPLRNVITRAIGSQARVNPEIQSVEAYAGDIVLLTSDGLTRELHDLQIAEILDDLPSHPTADALEHACESLIAHANANGGRDNITVLLLAIG